MHKCSQTIQTRVTRECRHVFISFFKLFKLYFSIFFNLDLAFFYFKASQDGEGHEAARPRLKESPSLRSVSLYVWGNNIGAAAAKAVQAPHPTDSLVLLLNDHRMGRGWEGKL